MRTTKRPVRSVVAVAVAASLMFGTAACGSDSDASASAPKVESTTMDDTATTEMGDEAGSVDVASNSPASGLRSTLTAGLTEHVYLTGICGRTRTRSATPPRPTTEASIWSSTEPARVGATRSPKQVPTTTFAPCMNP